jgi:hypothetical protein
MRKGYLRGLASELSKVHHYFVFRSLGYPACSGVRLL